MIEFRKAKNNRWAVYGPASEVVAGTTVSATRRNGTEHVVEIESVSRPIPINGTEYVYGYFRNDVAEKSLKRDGCWQCGKNEKLFKARDSNGVNGWCCMSCVRLSQKHRNFPEAR